MKRVSIAEHQAEIDRMRAEYERACQRVAETIQQVDQLLEQERREQAAHEQKMRGLPDAVD